MAYNNRIGVVVLTDPSTGNQNAYRTNIANSVHKGLESYLEFNIVKFINKNDKNLYLSIKYYGAGEYVELDISKYK